jgi:erythromycin esterase-like protein
MVETLAALVEHLDRQAGREGATKVAVWAHNSHLGDARATAAADRGELNVGQLVRERWGGEAFLLGFSTYAGTVTAARDWGMPAERRRVRPGLPGSYEALFHAASAGGGGGAGRESAQRPDFCLPLREGATDPTLTEALRPARLERFIGVIYRPETERWSHYYEADLPRQFDALLYFDHTRAVEPLERTPRWEAGEPARPGEAREAPETFPSTL